MAEFITWDWKEQLPLERLCELVNGPDRAFLAEIMDTGGDQYALLVTKSRFNPAEAQALWDAFMSEPDPGDSVLLAEE
jgi:hypothetical protein